MKENMWSWFLYTVEKWDDNTVIKTARNNSTSIADEQNSLTRHKDFLQNYVVEWDFYMPKYWRLESHQEFIDGSPVDLQKEYSRSDVQDILARWKDMQDTSGYLFDLFWLKGLVNIFNYLHDWGFWKISKLGLPISARLLEQEYNFPKELLYKMDSDTQSSPFIAYNLLRSTDDKLLCIDTDNRPIDIMHPLNILWRVYTQKILEELEKNKNM
jgi:hypothetical protein